MFQLPNKLPSEDLSVGVNAMMMIIAEAENVFGHRDTSYKINPTIKYGDHSPRASGMVINGEKICIVHLSNGSKAGWPCFLFEMAHEAVHILNPRNDPASYLEEGIAVWFSQIMCKKYGFRPNAPTGKYRRALELIKSLPEEPPIVVSKIRELYPNLTDLTQEELLACYSSISALTAKRLVAKMV